MSFSGTDRYTITRRIGIGGMGTVYLARDQLRDSTVALKLMHEVSSSNLVTFKREFRSMADLRHQNLVRLLELTDTGNEIFYTMEHVDGLNLRDVIAQRPNRTSELSAPDTPLAELSKGANDRVPPLPISNLGSVSSPLRDASEVPPPAGATDIERMYQILPQILDSV